MTQLQLSPASALALPLAVVLALLYSLTSFTFAQCLLSLCLSLSLLLIRGILFTNARHDDNEDEGDEHKMKSMKTIEHIFTTPLGYALW